VNIAVSKVFAIIKIIMQNKPVYTVNFQPIGKRIEVEKDQSLLSAAQSGGIAIASLCGGIGVCDSCKIRLIIGRLTEPSLEETAVFSDDELKSGFRLACQSFPLSDLTIEIPPESLTAPQRLQVEGQEVAFQIEPLVKPIPIEIPPPSINDLRSDTIRLKEALAEKCDMHSVSIELPVLETLSPLLRNYQWHVLLAMRNNVVVGVLPAHTSLLGLAVDIGTTKIAAYLCDLSTGNVLSKSGAMNPQTAFGEDVISRISFINTNKNGHKLLQSRLVDTLNNLINDLCLLASNQNSRISPDQIVEMVVVGNTAMHHIFAGLPVQQLGIAPYVPAVSEPIEISAHAIGLNISPGAMIFLPSNIAGYVGADHVAMLLSTGLPQASKTSIALDIGTNTEITLFYKDRLFSCSCASGPAFEGAHIQAGMRAAPGAIERVQVIHGEIHIQTIDDLKPVGICGSGILDTITCMHELGIIDHRGAFITSSPQIRQSAHGREFVIVGQEKSGNGRDIVVTRQDINEIQLAKGAIRTGIEVLLEYAGITSAEIEDFIIAGAFGSYINIPSAVKIGMFPGLPVNRFRQVGNAAGTGARQMLLSVSQRQAAEKIANRVEYIELSIYPNFTKIFSKSLFI
jgi:uncharacterized 2Fe-2S/4Fe-4S cluster protein (DUF4445 family)